MSFHTEAAQIGVEAIKKGIPMAGQKLADFFAKEGMKKAGQQVVQQATNVGKTLYQNRAELAAALGDDLTAVGKGIMKGPETIRGGAKFVGDAASKAAGKVGEAAVGAGAKVGGEAGAQGVRNVGKMIGSPYGIATGIGGWMGLDALRQPLRRETRQDVLAQEIASKQYGGILPEGWGTALAKMLGADPYKIS